MGEVMPPYTELFPEGYIFGCYVKRIARLTAGPHKHLKQIFLLA